jgi:ABC-type nickel/cobalt efflux system permease component RcnA
MIPLFWLCAACLAHDIPNARIDRSIQATVEPGRLRVDYEVGLSELTLTQELRQLVGELPGADRQEWFNAYGRETGPLNARGFLAAVDGVEVELSCTGFDLAVEDHPRYTFHLVARLPERGRLNLNDTNFASSEGTSRLAIQGVGVAIHGDSLPGTVAAIPIKPVWQMNDAEERRTHRLSVDFEPETLAEKRLAEAAPVSATTPRPDSSLSRLLDAASQRAWPGLLAVAVLLGAAHAIQPGHGKTLVVAATLGPSGGPLRGALLGLATATAHLTSVALVALITWATRSTQVGAVHLALARVSGFAIALVGFWRLGRHLGGFAEHPAGLEGTRLDTRGILLLGLAGGAVPCWDAVALVILAAAIGQLPLGLGLLAAFSIGMAAVLVTAGLLASRIRDRWSISRGGEVWSHRLGAVGGLLLGLVGLVLLSE